MMLDIPPAAPPAAARDRHLFSPGPKRILAIDGGGVRGVIAVAMIERIEAVLAARVGHPVRLCDYFDLIGGTSSGAITGALLALGFRGAVIREFYARFAPKVFRRSMWHVPGLQAKFDGRVLGRELAAVLGDRRLDSADLLTGLAIVMKRIDTGSPWVVTNNPRAVFWETPADRSFTGNRFLPLANLVRASTAAPSYFDPELLPIGEGQPPGLFIDGAVTPHKNPSLQLLMLALIDAYALRWSPGRDRLLLVSVGTGSFHPRMSQADIDRATAMGLAIRALRGLIVDSDALGITLLHWLSGSPAQWPLNSELGALTGQQAPFGEKLMTYHRYDVPLEAEWLARELGVAVGEDELEQLHHMERPESMPRLRELAEAAAVRLIGDADFPAAFDGGLAPPED
jgi:Patatin-like phospholipase